MNIFIDEKSKLCMENWGGDNYKRTWMGIMARKNPADAWIYQEIIYKCKPDTIIECGAYRGGGALFLASMLDLIGKGKVITIDDHSVGQINPIIKDHPRIKYIDGKSINVFEEVKSLCVGSVMVILDSDHSTENVAKELELYSTIVTPNQYLIVEDTNYLPEGGGPLPAVLKFLHGNEYFEMDRTCEEFGLTNNPQGYIKRNGRL